MTYQDLPVLTTDDLRLLQRLMRAEEQAAPAGFAGGAMPSG